MTTLLDTCPNCGAALKLVRERVQMEMGSRSAKIDIERLRCESCGEVFVTPEQMLAAQLTLANTLRTQERLLVPEQIRAFREKNGLTQTQLEVLIGAGPKTVVRWERGTVFQNATADLLLRILDAVPEALAFVAKEKGLTLKKSAPHQLSAAEESPQTVRVPMPASSADRRGKVTDIAFGRERIAKRLQPSRELEIPVISKEALQ